MKRNWIFCYVTDFSETELNFDTQNLLYVTELNFDQQNWILINRIEFWLTEFTSTLVAKRFRYKFEFCDTKLIWLSKYNVRTGAPYVRHTVYFLLAYNHCTSLRFRGIDQMKLNVLFLFSGQFHRREQDTNEETNASFCSLNHILMKIFTVLGIIVFLGALGSLIYLLVSFYLTWTESSSEILS